MRRILAVASVAVASAWPLVGCSSVTLPLPCDLMIVALPADSTLEPGEPLPAEPQIIAAPGDFDALGSSIATDETGQVSLDLKLRRDAIARFAGHTAGHLGEPIAIVINGEVVSVPTVESSIPAGEVSIHPATADGAAFAQRFAGCVR